MPSRRGAIALTDEEQTQFMEDGRTLQVASNGHKGYPHLVAMWYVVVDGTIVFHTFRKSQKILNLQRNPKITVMLESGKAYSELKGLVIEGEAEIIDDAEYTHKMMLLTGAKYSGLPLPAEPGAVSPQATKRVVVRVKPVNIVSWDHTKLGGRY